MSTFEPGRVAVATVCGQPNVRVFRWRDVYGHDRWDTSEPVDDRISYDDEHVTDVRPLVVLDPEALHWGTAENVARCLREHDRPGCDLFDRLADQIEAQVKPPRIPEPGLWGVVKASVEERGRLKRGRFVRDGEDGMWECLDWSGTYSWTYLVDPVEIRAGIEDGAS